MCWKKIFSKKEKTMAETTRANGMFISEYQKSFKNLGNLDYIFIRSSDGLYTDVLFHTMLPEVKTIECRGAVHNFRPDKPWKEQADKFIKLFSGEKFKVLCGDFESGVLNKQAAIDFFCFLSYVQQQRPNKKVIFYTTIYILRDNLLLHQGADTEFGKIDWHLFGYWIARYYVSKNLKTGLTTLMINPQTKEPSLNIGDEEVYDEWDFFQYWADGNQQGAKFGCGSRDTNCDVFNGTVIELKKYFNTKDPPLPPPPPLTCEEKVDSIILWAKTMGYEG